MNKYVGVREIARTSGVTMAEINRVFSAVVLLVRKHGEVRVRGFGRFTPREYQARQIILNGKTIEVEEHRVLHFNSSKQANRMLSVKGAS
jgi:nucleoid DNA-binding protein